MIGDEIVRNSEKMYNSDYWSDDKIILINTGAKFEVTDVTTYYSVVENGIGDKYKVGPTDIRKYFGLVEPKEKIKETKSCTCDSRDLMFFGCTCDCIDNKLNSRIAEMWSGISGE